jgi:hypothetical protein
MPQGSKLIADNMPERLLHIALTFNTLRKSCNRFEQRPVPLVGDIENYPQSTLRKDQNAALIKLSAPHQYGLLLFSANHHPLDSNYRQGFFKLASLFGGFQSAGLGFE